MKRIFYITSYFLIGFITVFLIEINLIAGIVQKPAGGSVYLGTVHSASDYFSYLSYMQQGRNHLFSSTDLYTEENVPLNLTRWQFVMFGKIFYLLNIDVTVGYQIMVILFLILFLLAGFMASGSIFTGENGKRLLAFLFFATSTSLPAVSWGEKGITIGYFTYWYNNANMWVRFGPTPHHLLGGALLLFGFSIAVNIIKDKKSPSKWLALPVISLLMTSISPVLWVILTGSLVITGFSLWISKRKGYFFLPAILVFTGGLPALIYTFKALSIPPWTNGAVFERQQQINVSLVSLIKGSGLVIPLAVLGIKNFIKEKKGLFERLGALTFIILSIAGFYSGVSGKIGVTNMRFLPPALYLFIGAQAAEGMDLIKNIRRVFFIAVIGIYILLTAVSDFSQAKEIWNDERNTIYVYLPGDTAAVFNFVKYNTPFESVFLVQPPLHVMFPALTGHRSMLGESDLTINPVEKFADAAIVSQGKLDDRKEMDLFKKHHIDYVLSEINTPGLVNKPYLLEIFRNGGVVIYKVLLDI